MVTFICVGKLLNKNPEKIVFIRKINKMRVLQGMSTLEEKLRGFFLICMLLEFS
ncbi:unnamed protein product [Moneuplotes crassus]|uniref:Uncharacterized protein n=1 Tax=Euplotes crassus TaxID=5936 RepID=A0AAD1XZ41_EUPCR|nr:unnamed protein product [Moneuplotes crassus]